MVSSTLAALRGGGGRARARPSSWCAAAGGGRPRGGARPRWSALDAADAEDELLERLEDLGVPEAWRVAEPLAAAGLDERLAASAWPRPRGRPPDAAVALGRSDAHRAQPRRRARRSPRSACRSLVGAVKSYAYMDRGALVEVDLHEGLETTLVVLGHKLKHTSIEVVRDYDKHPPEAHRARVGAQPGLDEPARQRDRRARRARARSRSCTTRDGDCAQIEITDDGPGIPPENRDHVFDVVLHHQGRRARAPASAWPPR